MTQENATPYHCLTYPDPDSEVTCIMAGDPQPCENCQRVLNGDGPPQ